MIGEILAGVSALSSLFASLKSAQANKLADAQLRKRQSELDVWYNKEYNQNYLDTDEAKSIMTILENQRKEQMKKVDQNNAIKGASDEARIATADKLNRGIADNVTRLAGYGTRYKDMMRREYQGLKSNLDTLDWQNLQAKAQNWANFGNNAMSAGIGFAEAAGNGAFDTWENRYKNWRKAKMLQKAGGQIAPVETNNIKIPNLYNP